MSGRSGRASRDQVLGVGIATVDLINEVAAYPPEDAEVRALAQQVQRGGNCTNSLAVLAQLGRRCRWVGTLADDAGARLIRADLDRLGIDYQRAVTHPGGATPTSCIAVSRASGSRTIIHHRDLPELDAAGFAAVPLDGCAWVHFEGRNPEETARMIARVRGEIPTTPISLEIEKPRPGIARLFDAIAAPPMHARLVLIVARAYVEAVGGADAEGFLRAGVIPEAVWLRVLPWGRDGAYLSVRGAPAMHLAPHRPPALVDTLAAGDVFNAGLVDGLLGGLEPALAVVRANRLAGYKCGRPGLDGLIAEARALGFV